MTVDSCGYKLTVVVVVTGSGVWLNAEKKFGPKNNKGGPSETAEDMVGKLLNLNVQVNVTPDGG